MILYFLLSIVIFVIIVEVITVLFKLTGLSEEKARFQVISLLTGAGFTTKESELITQHPSRRRLAQILMITGYIGFLTGISFLVDIIKKSLSFENLIVLIIFFLLILMFFRNKFLLSYFDSIIEKFILKRHFKTKNPAKIYKLITRAKGYGVFNILIDEKSKLVGVALKDSNLKPHNIIILNIDKGNQFIGFPTRDYVIEKEDNILLYGKVEEIMKTFNIGSK
ncbi:TrkA C-terminal domain-containing protein [Clostridium sp. DJ247]|uniref:TrkA C-terminal domain-containing protein n=1 Tax=Clostridium sp. DJ247 TaxID=2726188 RepID=UPI001F4CF936|nr:TrkA C-terminal domain-containing protein [Clostridium sp. DJ247]